MRVQIAELLKARETIQKSLPRKIAYGKTFLEQETFTCFNTFHDCTFIVDDSENFQNILLSAPDFDYYITQKFVPYTDHHIKQHKTTIDISDSSSLIIFNLDPSTVDIDNVVKQANRAALKTIRFRGFSDGVLLLLTSENQNYSEFTYKAFMSRFDIGSIPANEAEQNEIWSELSKCRFFNPEDIKKQILGEAVFPDYIDRLTRLVKFNTKFGRIMYEICFDKIVAGELKLDSKLFQLLSDSPFFSYAAFSPLILREPASVLVEHAKSDTALGNLSYTLLVADEGCNYSADPFVQLMQRLSVFFDLKRSPFSRTKNPDTYFASIFNVNARPVAFETMCASLDWRLNDLFSEALGTLVHIYHFLHQQFDAKSPMQLAQQKDFIVLLKEIAAGKISTHAQLVKRLKSNESEFATQTGFLSMFAPVPPYVEIRNWLHNYASHPSLSNLAEMTKACQLFLDSLQHTKSDVPFVKRLQTVLVNPLCALQEVNKGDSAGHQEMKLR